MHRLTAITLGVPDVAATAAYYTDFGLTPLPGGDEETRRFSTVDGGEQLTLEYASRRQLFDLGIGVDDPDDLDRVVHSLQRSGAEVERSAASVVAGDPGTGVRIHVEISPRIAPEPSPAPAYNRPGGVTRPGLRADAVLRDGPVRPRKLGHVVLGSTDQETSQRFFTEGIGLKVSDTVPGIAAFLRCSTDHHNVLVQSAPVGFLHHTAESSAGSRLRPQPGGDAARAPGRRRGTPAPGGRAGTERSAGRPAP